MRDLIDSIIAEQDEGKGLDPLLMRYVYNRRDLDPDRAKKRERAITSYYQEIIKRSNDSNVAYDRTNAWARKIFP